MLKNKEKHYFLGGNTPKGFYSYYDYLLPQENARKIYCIKGGPGTGKSSLMKKVASAVSKKGIDIEYAHCSSDPSSLDGIVIKPLNIALVDGTSPHIVDPKTPGAVDEILYMGDCWDASSISRHKEGIIKTNRKISEQFSRAYVYLASAKLIAEDLDKIYEKAIKGNPYGEFEESIIYTEFAEIPVSDTKGTVRRLFASGITPEGIVNYTDTLLDGYKTYVLKGYTGDILLKICNIAVNRGFDTECYYCPFSPDSKCDHLVIPKLNLAFTVCNKYHAYEKGEVVDFDEYASKYVLETYKDERAFAAEEVEKLINKAVYSIVIAKQYHDELEKYYIPAMNFDKAEEIVEKTIKEILEFI